MLMTPGQVSAPLEMSKPPGTETTLRVSLHYGELELLDKQIE